MNSTLPKSSNKTIYFVIICVLLLILLLLGRWHYVCNIKKLCTVDTANSNNASKTATSVSNSKTSLSLTSATSTTNASQKTNISSSNTSTSTASASQTNTTKSVNTILTTTNSNLGVGGSTLYEFKPNTNSVQTYKTVKLDITLIPTAVYDVTSKLSILNVSKPVIFKSDNLNIDYSAYPSEYFTGILNYMLANPDRNLVITGYYSADEIVAGNLGDIGLYRANQIKTQFMTKCLSANGAKIIVKSHKISKYTDMDRYIKLEFQGK